MRCYRKILLISYKDHVTNWEVCEKLQQAVGPHDDLLTILKRRKLKWYVHVRCSSGLAKTIFQGTMKGGRRQGRWKKRWEKRGGNTTSGNGQAWSLLSPQGSEENRKMEETGCEIICGAPTTLAVKGQVKVKESIPSSASQSPSSELQSLQLRAFKTSLLVSIQEEKNWASCWRAHFIHDLLL